MDSVNGGASSVSPFFNPAVPTLADLDGTLILTANGDGGPNDLWRSDGSASGTSQIDGGVLPDHPRDLTRFGDHVYFTSGSVWRTDGATPEVFDQDWWNYNLTAAGPHLFYLKNPWSGGEDLQGTDGTTITKLLSTWNRDFDEVTAAGTNLFFARRTLDGEELWKSAGAPNDTVLLRTFPYAWPRQMGYIAGFGNSVYFAANDGSTGQELWFSNGTAAGTRLVKDIVPGAGSSAPHSIVAAGNLAFFLADEGVAGTEL
jgi:ELWxxDGT repeat protein